MLLYIDFLIKYSQVSIQDRNNVSVASQVDLISPPDSNLNMYVFLFLFHFWLFCLFCQHSFNSFLCFRLPFLQRCFPQDPVFGVTGSCAVKVSGILHSDIFVGSVTFLLRKVPTGFYQISFSTTDQSFKSNIFQIFIHNPSPPPPVPQPLSGPNLKNARGICTVFLKNVLYGIAKYIGGDVTDSAVMDIFVDIFSPSNVFSVESSLTNDRSVPLSDLYFKEVPNFFYSAPLVKNIPNPNRALVTNVSSSGTVILLSAPDFSDRGGVFPIVWHLHNDTSNLLCVSNPFGGNLSIYWMSRGVTSVEPLALPQSMIRVISAHVTQNIPAVVPLSVALNSSRAFTVNVSFVCDLCIDTPDQGTCVCEPTLIARVVKLDSSSRCGVATISSMSSNGFNSFGSPTCKDSVFIPGTSALEPQSILCSFKELVIDSATFGCIYELEIISPYSSLVIAKSSNFTVCAIYPLAVSDAPLCFPKSTPANYSLFTWSGIFIPPGPPPSLSIQPQFVDILKTEKIVTSFSRGQKASFVVNLCGASVFSTMNVAFQPNFPSSFSNPSAGMQLEVSVNSIDDDAQTIATCSLWVQRGPRCIATVVSGNCIVLPFSNGDTCFSNTRTQKAFFCQSQYNPATVPDLQLQLFFKDVVPANDIGNFKIVVNGSGSSSSNGIGSYWGFAPPEECATSFLLMFCESFVILMHLNLSVAGLSVLPRCSEIF